MRVNSKIIPISGGCFVVEGWLLGKQFMNFIKRKSWKYYHVTVKITKGNDGRQNVKQNERNREKDKQVKHALYKQRRDVLLRNDESVHRNISVICDVSFISINLCFLSSMRV
jgi:hypothetical protein